MRARLLLILLLTTGAVWLSAAAWIYWSTQARVEQVQAPRLVPFCQVGEPAALARLHRKIHLDGAPGWIRHRDRDGARAERRAAHQLQRRIVQLDRRNILSNREAARLHAESRQLEQRLRYASHNGLNQREMYIVERGIQRLEYRIQREARDGNRYGGYYGQNNYYGQNGYADRDRDGRNDRYEDDRGWDHD